MISQELFQLDNLQTTIQSDNLCKKGACQRQKTPKRLSVETSGNVPDHFQYSNRRIVAAIELGKRDGVQSICIDAEVRRILRK